MTILQRIQYDIIRLTRYIIGIYDQLEGTTYSSILNNSS